MTAFALTAALLPGGRIDEWHPGRPAYVVADVDGMLVGTSPVATDVVVAAALSAAEEGIAIGVATGRFLRGVVPLLDQRGLVGPHLVHNGAEVRVGGVVVKRWSFTAAQRDALAAMCHARGWYGELFVGDGYVVTSTPDEARAHWEMMGSGPDAVVEGSVAHLDVIKASVVVFDRARVGAVVAGVESLGLAAGVALSPLLPTYGFVNITHPDADKGRALVWAAGSLGIDLSQVVAIGDASNDLTMLSVAGTAIAMGQADDEVKAAAHVVVPEVDADGVAHALDAVRAWVTSPRREC